MGRATTITGRARRPRRPLGSFGLVLVLGIGASLTTGASSARAEVEPSVTVDVSWTRPGIEGRLAPPAAARVGDEVTVALVASGIPQPTCSIQLNGEGSRYQISVYSTGAADQCTPWTFVIPPVGGGIQTLTTYAYSLPDGSILARASATFVIESGGTERPFASNYPVVSWDHRQAVPDGISFGQPVALAQPPNASSYCRFGLSGEWWSSTWTHAGPCTPWQLTLPEMRPDGFRDGAYGGPWGVLLHVSATRGPLDSGEELQGGTTTELIPVDGAAATSFASDRAAVIFGAAANPRFQYPGAITITPSVAGVTSGNCRYSWLLPGATEASTRVVAMVGGTCPPLTFESGPTLGVLQYQVGIVTGSFAAIATGASGVQIVDQMPKLEILTPDAPVEDAAVPLTAITEAGAPVSYSFEVVPQDVVTTAGTGALAATGARVAEPPSCSGLTGRLDGLNGERSATATCTFATAGTYVVSTTFVDAVGTARETSRELVVRPDSTAPTATPPKPQLAPGAILGSSGIPVRVVWSGADAGSGIGRYILQQSVDRGSWSSISSTLTSRSVTRSVRPGHSYRYRVRSVDRAGNMSAWATGPTVTPAAHSEASAAIRYRGTWRYGYTSSAYGGRLRYASARGASASVAFTGRSVAWAAPVGPTRGRARVYLDGVLIDRVSLYATTEQRSRIVFSRTWSAVRTRRLTVVLEGTSGRPRVDVDALFMLR